MQNQSFRIHFVLATFARRELSMLLLCVGAIALGMGAGALHGKRSPVTCSGCAVIENTILRLSRELWKSNMLVVGLSRVCPLCCPHAQMQKE